MPVGHRSVALVNQQVQGSFDLLSGLGQIGRYTVGQELGQIIQGRRQPNNVLQDVEGFQGLYGVDRAVPSSFAYLVNGTAVMAGDFGLDLVVYLIQAHQPT